MSRLAAILSALLFAVAAPAAAAIVEFQPRQGGSSVNPFTCTPTLGQCGIKRPKFDFADEDDGDFVADPVAFFQFLEISAKDNEGEDEFGEEDDDKKDKKDDLRIGTFSTTVTLMLKVINTPFIVPVTSVGTGSYETDGDNFTRFSLIWSPIARIVIAGAGSFDVAFETLDPQRGDKKDDDDFEDVYVNVRISAVPLPAGAVLLLTGLGLVGVAGLRRRAR